MSIYSMPLSNAYSTRKSPTSALEPQQLMTLFQSWLFLFPIPGYTATLTINYTDLAFHVCMVCHRKRHYNLFL